MADATLGVKIGRFLDNVFQNFCANLSEYIFERDPLPSARRGFEYRFEDQVQSFFNGIRNGIVPAVLLPKSLTPSSSITGMTKESSLPHGQPQKTKQAQSKGKGKMEANSKVRPQASYKQSDKGRRPQQAIVTNNDS
jgi:hypothetical protein